MSETDNDARLTAVLNGTVPEVIGRLVGLSPDDLIRLEELEQSGKNRVGVMEAIDAAFTTAADAAGANDGEEDEDADHGGDSGAGESDQTTPVGDGEGDAAGGGSGDLVGGGTVHGPFPIGGTDDVPTAEQETPTLSEVDAPSLGFVETNSNVTDKDGGEGDGATDGNKGGKDADGIESGAAGKAARGEEQGDAPAWQKPDYSGPMTHEIAEWRHKNLIRK